MSEQMAFARTTDPETSHEAARSVKKITESQELILEMFRERGPMTDNDLEEAYAAHVNANGSGGRLMSESGLRTRRSELVRQVRLADTGRHHVLPSGRKAIVWALNQGEK